MEFHPQNSESENKRKRGGKIFIDGNVYEYTPYYEAVKTKEKFLDISK